MNQRSLGGDATPVRGRSAEPASSWVGILVLVSAAVVISPRPWLAQGSSGPTPTAAGLTLRDVVSITLSRNVEIGLAERAVDAQVASVLQAGAPFDPVFQVRLTRDRARTPSFNSSDLSTQVSNTRGLDYEAGIDWRLRAGAILEPTLSFTRTGSSATPELVRNTAVAGLNLSVPLLRGRNGGLAAALERAASGELDASRTELAHVRATVALAAIVAYWGHVGAMQIATALRASEERAATLLQQTKTLILADERPASDSIQVSANLAAKAAARLASEDGISTARETLADAMGIPVDQLGLLSVPVDSFPTAPDSSVVATWPSASTWIAVALKRRSDASAARARAAISHSLIGASRNEERSAFDLVVGATYTGIELGTGLERLFSPFQSAPRGVRTALGFTYGFPIGGRAAAAQLHRSIIASEQASLVAVELERKTTIAVATSAEVLRRTVEQLRLSEDAVALFARFVEAETEKYRLGVSTLFDLIKAQDDLAGATVALINAQRRHAVAIAQLRHATGMLLATDSCVPERFDRLPVIEHDCAP